MNNNITFKALKKIATASVLICTYLCSAQVFACYLCQHCSSYNHSDTGLTEEQVQSFSCSAKKCESSSGLGCDKTCKAIQTCTPKGVDGTYTCTCSYTY